MLGMRICLPSWGDVWVGGLLAILCSLSYLGLVPLAGLLQLGLVHQK